MDFLIVHSNYSDACNKLFEEYPKLRETKSICADSAPIRKIIIDDMKVTAVPTLLVLGDKTVLQRIIGSDAIKNWLWIVSNDINQVSEPAATETFEDDMMPPIGQTILEDVPEIPQMKKTNSLKNTAEEMQRERDLFIGMKPAS